MSDEQLHIKEYDQALWLIDELKKKIVDGEVTSLMFVCEHADGSMFGGTTATQNQFAVAGYMLCWAMRRLGFASFDDVRMMLEDGRMP